MPIQLILFLRENAFLYLHSLKIIIVLVQAYVNFAERKRFCMFARVNKNAVGRIGRIGLIRLMRLI